MSNQTDSSTWTTVARAKGEPFNEVSAAPCNSPLVEGLLAGVVLQAALVDQELHPLEERGGDGWWLLSQKYIDRLRSRHAKLTATTHMKRATFRVRAIDETVWKAHHRAIRIGRRWRR